MQKSEDLSLMYCLFNSNFFFFSEIAASVNNILFYVIYGGLNVDWSSAQVGSERTDCNSTSQRNQGRFLKKS